MDRWQSCQDVPFLLLWNTLCENGAPCALHTSINLPWVLWVIGKGPPDPEGPKGAEELTGARLDRGQAEVRAGDSAVPSQRSWLSCNASRNLDGFACSNLPKINVQVEGSFPPERAE